jgi:simple sugar transport system permease protein
MRATVQKRVPESASETTEGASRGIVGVWTARLRGFLYRWGVLVALVALIAYLSYSVAEFLTFTNWTNLIRDMAVETLIALAVTVSVVVNGFDVSVGANAGLAVILSTVMMVQYGASTVVAVGVALGAGLVVGLVNALMILRFRLPDLLATLGMLFVVDGVQQTIATGQTITPGMTLPNGKTGGDIPSSFLAIDRGSWLGIPIPIILMAAVVVVLMFFFGFTRWGRLMYAVGSNPEAARLSGMHVTLYKAGAYLLAGLLAALGGVVLAARIGVGEQLAGDAYLLNAVGATMIGFAVLGAGRANILGTVVGALLMAVMVNGFTMQNVSYYSQEVLLGVVMLGALALSYAVRERS